MKNAIQSHPWKTSVLLALAGAVLGLVIASALPTRYGVSVAYTVNQRQLQETTAYTYDGYYALQATQLFTDTLIGWFATPSVAVEIYRQAGLPLADDAAAKAASAFKPKRFSSQLVTVRFDAKTQSDAAKLAAAAATVVSAKTDELNRNAKGDSLFIVQASDPVIAPARLDPRLAAGVGLLLGAFLGYLLWFATGETKTRE